MIHFLDYDRNAKEYDPIPESLLRVKNLYKLDGHPLTRLTSPEHS